MIGAKKDKLLVSDLVQNPIISYPIHYKLSLYQLKNEILHDAIIALHMCDFEHYETPRSYDDMFDTFNRGGFAIYNENHIVGFFGSKMMYLESQGWKGLPATKEIFDLKNWLI